MKAVIYARYSSDNQREESIEGQLRECTAYCKKNNITILRTYIDRAMSAKTDHRPDFQRMIKDSAKGLFDVIIVWKLDRFARNRYDSATYKAKLKKNGVRVLSARENITDDASGILIEGVLEASYPSSTTMLMMCIMPTAIMQFHHLISSKRLRNIVNAFCGIYASFMVIGRVLSGVHWFTDIVGGILLSATLVMLYYSTNQLVNSKASRSSQRSR